MGDPSAPLLTQLFIVQQWIVPLVKMRSCASKPRPSNAAIDQVDQVEDEELLLADDQAELIDTFRRDVRLCETDAEKFRLCAEVRSQLLSRHTEVVLLITLFDRVMLAECRDYRNYKQRDRNPEREQNNAKEWDRFIGVAATGADIINKCLPHLKAVSVRWGREKLQYYNWPAKGWKFCKTLGAVANKMAWVEFTTKANQLLRRRVQMDGKLRRQRIGLSRDPLKPVELQNIVKWADEEPYVKDKDPEKVSLPFKNLSVQDLPPGYTLDKYGLMVRVSTESFATISTANESALKSNGDFTSRHQELVRLLPAFSTDSDDTRYPAPPTLDAQTENPGRSEHSTPSRALAEYFSPEPLPPLFGEDHGSGTSRWDDVPLPGWNDTDEGQADGGFQMPSTLVSSDIADEEREANSQNPQAVAATSRLRPRQVSANPYHETAPKGSNAKQHRTRLLKNFGRLGQKCCPPEVPAELLAMLDESDNHASSQMLSKISLCNYPLEDLCLMHLKKLSQSIVSAKNFELLPQSPRASKFVESGGDSSLKRRRASFSELEADSVKRLCTKSLDIFGHSSLSTMLQDRLPFPDPLGNELYRHQVLKELTEAALSPSSRGWRTDRIIFIILQNSKRPSSEEAYFLSGDEAAQKVESGIVDAPIFTHGQQHFRWKSPDRPIAQLFHYMEDVGLERSVPVQIPSRNSQDNSFEFKTLAQVRDRFLTQRSTNDPWNLLDLQCPVPCALPSFLGGENCQLLLRIRDICLMGSNAQRVEASGNDWNSWRNVLEWGLLSEGGNNTAPHVDSNGYSTWITVQEGQIGFGWMSRIREQEKAWISDPINYTGGEWRYVILSPGETVFLPSGTIHFVFRKREVQTFSLGGHVLQWSGMERWLEVLIAQINNPDITNEDIGSASQKHVKVVKELVRNRIATGRVLSMGGPDTIARVNVLLKVRNLTKPANLPIFRADRF